MSDRRQRNQPVSIERRHGERRTYQTGCRCLPCCAANAHYQEYYRTLLRTGRVPLGSRTDARETWRLITHMEREGFSRTDIARLLGLKRPILELHHVLVTVRNALKIRRLVRLKLSDDAHS